MKDSRQILNYNLRINGESIPDWLMEKIILPAMEEYAEQQAIEFSNWCMEQQAKSQGYNYSHTSNNASYKVFKNEK